MEFSSYLPIIIMYVSQITKLDIIKIIKGIRQLITMLRMIQVILKISFLKFLQLNPVYLQYTFLLIHILKIQFHLYQPASLLPLLIIYLMLKWMSTLILEAKQILLEGSIIFTLILKQQLLQSTQPVQFLL